MRSGKHSRRQQSGFELWLEKFSLPLDMIIWDLDLIFGRHAEIIVEIGFGMGESLMMMAQQQPEINFIGIEVNKAGIGSLAADLHEHGITNVRIVNFDAVAVFNTYITPGSLAGIQIFFPDPWPKKKHHKRRLINYNFAQALITALKPSGFIHCATDWHDYAQNIFEIFNTQFQLVFTKDYKRTRPETKFEQRGNNLGLKIYDLIFLKTAVLELLR